MVFPNVVASGTRQRRLYEHFSNLYVGVISLFAVELLTD